MKIVGSNVLRIDISSHMIEIDDKENKFDVNKHYRNFSKIINNIVRTGIIL